VLIGLLVFLLMLPIGCGDPSASKPGAENAAAVDAAGAAPDENAEAGGDEGVSDEDKLSAEELEELVGRIALYPDDLLAQVLPASTYPLDIVEAARFLEENAGASEPPGDSSWDPSVIALLPFPDVLAMMSDDVTWTRRLGDALWTQEEDVYDAIQAFRLRTQAAGNLESDDKVVIVREKETIKIVPANPEVVYVPVYQPQTVVVKQTSYATPLIVWGTAVLFTAWAYSLTWGSRHHHSVHYHRHYHHHYRHHHYRKHHSHYNRHRYGHRGGSWNPSHRPGTGRPGVGRPGTGRPGSKPGKPGFAGSPRPGSSWGKQGRPGGSRPGGGQTARPGGSRPGATRPGGGQAARPSAGKADRAGSRPAASKGSYGSYGRGGDTHRQSARGSQSRQKPTSYSSRQQPRKSASSSRGGSYGSYKSGASTRRSSSRGHSSRGGGGRSRGGGGGRRR
jgi:hypothetical protein